LGSVFGRFKSAAFATLLLFGEKRKETSLPLLPSRWVERDAAVYFFFSPFRQVRLRLFAPRRAKERKMKSPPPLEKRARYQPLPSRGKERKSGRRTLLPPPPFGDKKRLNWRADLPSPFPCLYEGSFLFQVSIPPPWRRRRGRSGFPFAPHKRGEQEEREFMPSPPPTFSAGEGSWGTLLKRKTSSALPYSSSFFFL